MLAAAGISAVPDKQPDEFIADDVAQRLNIARWTAACRLKAAESAGTLTSRFVVWKGKRVRAWRKA